MTERPYFYILNESGEPQPTDDVFVWFARRASNDCHVRVRLGHDVLSAWGQGITDTADYDDSLPLFAQNGEKTQ